MVKIGAFDFIKKLKKQPPEYVNVQVIMIDAEEHTRHRQANTFTEPCQSRNCHYDWPRLSIRVSVRSEVSDEQIEKILKNRQDGVRLYSETT